MAKENADKLRALYAKYNAAYSKHKVFAMAIAEFAMAGDRPPSLLQDSEKEAARELAAVTDELRTGLTELVERSPGSEIEIAISVAVAFGMAVRG